MPRNNQTQSRPPLISIIMPAFNAATYVRESIDSILIQTYGNFELIVADDASTDKTRAIVDSYTDTRILTDHNTVNLGYLKTCNKLFDRCRGDFITFQDADDISHPHRLERQLDVFLEDETLGLVGTWAKNIGPVGKFLSYDSRPVLHEDIRSEGLSRNPVCGATAMLKRQVLQEIGGYRPFFDRLAYEDYDWVLLISEKFRCYNIPEHLYYYRQHQASYSKRIEPRRFVSDSLVRYLAKQRQTLGKDDLQRGEPEKVEELLREMLAPYEADKSLIYRQYAARFMWAKMHSSAIKSSILAICAAPFKPANWRTSFYCIRKTTISWMVALIDELKFRLLDRFHSHPRSEVSEESPRPYFLKPGYIENIDDQTPTETYIAPPKGDYYQLAFYIWIRNYIKRDPKVTRLIDIGCGTAFKTKKYLGDLGLDITCIEQPEFVDMCRREHPQFVWMGDNFESEKPQEYSQYDIVVCSDVIEHIVRPEMLINRIKACSHSDTAIFISTPERDEIRGSSHNGPSPNKKHVREWNAAELALFLTSQGLHIDEHRLLDAHRLNLKQFLAQLLGRVNYRTCQAVRCRTKS